MFWAVFTCFSPYLGNGCVGWVSPKGLVYNLMMQFLTLASSKIEITSQRLLDQSQAGVCRGKHHMTPILGPFGPIRVPYPKGLNC